MAWRRNARRKWYACWCCWPIAQADGSTVGEPIRPDGMVPHRSTEMLCLPVLLPCRACRWQHMSERFRHDGMAPHRSKETPRLLVPLARRNG